MTGLRPACAEQPSARPPCRRGPASCRCGCRRGIRRLLSDSSGSRRSVGGCALRRGWRLTRDVNLEWPRRDGAKWLQAGGTSIFSSLQRSRTIDLAGVAVQIDLVGECELGNPMGIVEGVAGVFAEAMQRAEHRVGVAVELFGGAGG